MCFAVMFFEGLSAVGRILSSLTKIWQTRGKCTIVQVTGLDCWIRKNESKNHQTSKFKEQTNDPGRSRSSTCSVNGAQNRPYARHSNLHLARRKSRRRKTLTTTPPRRGGIEDGKLR